MYTELQLSNLLACRSVCQNWQTTVDTFLSDHPSKLPFNKETHTTEEKLLELGRIPNWNKSPLIELIKPYRFVGVRKLDAFTTRGKSKIVGSTLWLDDIGYLDPFNENKLKIFLTTFGAQVKY